MELTYAFLSISTQMPPGLLPDTLSPNAIQPSRQTCLCGSLLRPKSLGSLWQSWQSSQFYHRGYERDHQLHELLKDLKKPGKQPEFAKREQEPGPFDPRKEVISKESELIFEVLKATKEVIHVKG